MQKYPREDKCDFCGVHLGWIMNSMGESVALNLCEKPECQKKAAAVMARKNMKVPKVGGKNGSESDKGK